MSDFVSYPQISHLAGLGSVLPRGDKLLGPAEASELLAGEVIVEEKLDGANLGVSVADDAVLRLQNRGQYLDPPYRGQFSRAGAWLAQHASTLVPELGKGLILFGEWCVARHSVIYDRLPDWFIGFDIYDRAARQFWCVARRNAWAERVGIAVVPALALGHIDFAQLKAFVTDRESLVGGSSLEGVIVRRDGPQFLRARAKLVNPAFTQGIGEHWRARPLEWNAVARA